MTEIEFRKRDFSLCAPLASHEHRSHGSGSFSLHTQFEQAGIAVMVQER